MTTAEELQRQAEQKIADLESELNSVRSEVVELRERAMGLEVEKAELKHYSKSGMSGHTHRIGYYGKKTYDGQSAWFGLGCCCALRTSYVSHPQWQQGFCVVVWSEDRKNFAVERVRVFDGVAYWRGRRYEG